MLKHALTVCTLALAGCAMNPAAGTAGTASDSVTDHHLANAQRVRCDRIKVICIDATVPGLMPTLMFPTITLPALPNLLSLPR
jgi:hypothetical protein